MNLDWAWLERNLEMISGLMAEHVILALVPVVVAFVISIPLGYLVSKTGKAADVLLAILGVIYSIPSLALFVLMPLVLGTQILNPVNIGAALAVYSIALLVRSVVDGLRSVSPSVKQAASAMGYGSFRRLLRVELLVDRRSDDRVREPHSPPAVRSTRCTRPCRLGQDRRRR